MLVLIDYCDQHSAINHEFCLYLKGMSLLVIVYVKHLLNQSHPLFRLKDTFYLKMPTWHLGNMNVNRACSGYQKNKKTSFLDRIGKEMESASHCFALLSLDQLMSLLHHPFQLISVSVSPQLVASCIFSPLLHCSVVCVPECLAKCISNALLSSESNGRTVPSGRSNVTHSTNAAAANLDLAVHLT